MGGAVGVIAGGLLTTYASWRWVFFVNVPIGLLLAVGARYVIPETQRHPRRLDLPGAITGTHSPLKGGLAYLPFIGGFIVMAGISSKLVNRVGARPLMMLGAVIAPVGLFWLSRVHPGSHYLTGVALPLVIFAMAAGLIFVPLTVTLVAGVSDEDSGVASSMFNAGRHAGHSRQPRKPGQTDNGPMSYWPDVREEDGGGEGENPRL